MPVEYHNQLAEWVKAVLKKHGNLSLRAAEYKTLVSYSTIHAMLNGRRPSPELLVQFAQGMKEDPIQALRLAGYDILANLMERGRASITLLPAEAGSAPLTPTETESVGELEAILAGHPEIRELLREIAEEMIDVGPDRSEHFAEMFRRQFELHKKLMQIPPDPQGTATTEESNREHETRQDQESQESPDLHPS